MTASEPDGRIFYIMMSWKRGGLQLFYSYHLRMPEALTAWAVMQALMNIDVTIEAEVLFAFGANYRKTGHVSCTTASRAEKMLKNGSTIVLSSITLRCFTYNMEENRNIVTVEFSNVVG